MRTVGEAAATARTANTRVVAAGISGRSAALATVSRKIGGVSKASGSAYATYPAAPLNPRNYGPLLGALVGLSNELHYVAGNQRPSLNPIQLPSSPSQTLVAGTLNAYSRNGNPFTVTVTGQPTNGTVIIDPTSGSYTYTPDEAIKAVGGTDAFTITATDVGFHPLATLFGQPAHTTTVTVPVKVAAAPAPTVTSGTTAYYVTNTSYQPMQIVTYGQNGATLSPALGQVFTTGQSAEFQIPNGATVQVGFNPVGVRHEGVLENITVGNNPATATISPDGSRLYVTKSSGSISVVDTASGLVSGTIPGSYSTTLRGVAMSPDGKRLYVVNTSNNSVAVIDTFSNTIVTTIPNVKDGNSVAVSPDGLTAYVTRNYSSSVWKIDTASNTVIGYESLTVGSNPSGLGFSPDGSRLYVANTGSNSVSVVDTASRGIISTIGVGFQPQSLAISPDGTRVYVAHGNSKAAPGGVSVIDTATNAVTADVQFPNVSYYNLLGPIYPSPAGLAVSPDGKYLYATEIWGPDAVVIDTATNAIVRQIAVPCYGPTCTSGYGPGGVSVSPKGDRIYVAALYSNQISVLGGVTNDPSDFGVAYYTVTMTGGSASCKANSGACATTGATSYLEDRPGTVYTVPADQAQQQSDILQNLVSDDTSNATFTTKSYPSIGYTNPLIPTSFTPYINNTTSDSTVRYTVTTTTSKTDSTTYAVSVLVGEKVKLASLEFKASQIVTTTWGTTFTDTNTYSQTTIETVKPGETLFLYTETPVQRFYGNWTVRYGNTTYELIDVWYDTPYAAGGVPSYLAAYTCQTGSQQCVQLASGDLSGYTPAFPTTTYYPVAESNIAGMAGSYGAAVAVESKKAIGAPRRLQPGH